MSLHIVKIYNSHFTFVKRSKKNRHTFLLGRDLSVLGGRYVKGLLKHSGKMLRIGIADGIRDILDRHIAVSEQCFGSLHADLRDLLSTERSRPSKKV